MFIHTYTQIMLHFSINFSIHNFHLIFVGISQSLENTRSLYQCEACGQACGDTRALYQHLETRTRKQPGGSTCLQQLGFNFMKDFKKNFSNKLKRNRVRHITNYPY